MKFIKGVRSSFLDDLTNLQLTRFYMKLLYEFWGFCVNGTNDLTTPGGIPTSGSFFPSGFTTGSSVHLASGSDGRTVFNSDVFYASANFLQLHAALTGANSSGLTGKYIVAWQAGSESTDDSVYRIMSVLSDSSVRVETHTGATARVTNKATFRDRTSINWRVVDIGAAARLANWTGGMGLVMQFPDATLVNENQLTPQLHVKLVTNDVTFQDLRLTMSPSGSWNGTTFTDFSGTVSMGFTGGAAAVSSGEALFYVLASKDTLITQVKGIDDSLSAGSSGFHFEVPKRLLSEQLDPNPLAIMTWSSSSTATQTTGYANRFSMIGPGAVFSTWSTLTRAPFGDITHTSIAANGAGLWEALLPTTRFAVVNYNRYTQKYIASDALLYQPTSGSYCSARARLRNVKFTAPSILRGTRFGPSWMHVTGGIVWPWDNSVQPFGVIPEGGL